MFKKYSKRLVNKTFLLFTIVDTCSLTLKRSGWTHGQLNAKIEPVCFHVNFQIFKLV